MFLKKHRNCHQEASLLILIYAFLCLLLGSTISNEVQIQDLLKLASKGDVFSLIFSPLSSYTKPKLLQQHSRICANINESANSFINSIYNY